MGPADHRQLRTRRRPLARFLAAVVLTGIGSACSDRSHSAPAPASTLRSAIVAALDEWRRSADPATGVTVPAAAAAVVDDDGNVVAVASGSDDAGPVTAGSVFRLASVTKLVTAAIVVQLDQEGRLSLDDPIARWVAYPNGAAITIAMLLSHTSGIPNLSDDLDDRDWSPQELVDAIAARGTADFAPGSSWAYSNTGYVLLGLIVERVTGRSWPEEVRARIAHPLGLETMHVHGWEDGPAPVSGYDLRCVGSDGSSASEVDCIGRPSHADVVEASPDWKFAWSAGAVVASAPDVARFVYALFAGNLLDDAHRERMLTPLPVTVAYMHQAYARSGARQLVLGVGLGPWLLDVEGVGLAVGHAGSIPGFNNSALYYPELGFGAVVLNNLMPAGPDPYVPGAAAIGGAARSVLASE